MRILVVSDTHGDLRSLIKAVDAQRKAEIIVHCGDGEEKLGFTGEELGISATAVCLLEKI